MIGNVKIVFFFRFDVWKGLNFSFISIYIEFCVACLCVQSSDSVIVFNCFALVRDSLFKSRILCVCLI